MASWEDRRRYNLGSRRIPNPSEREDDDSSCQAQDAQIPGVLFIFLPPFPLLPLKQAIPTMSHNTPSNDYVDLPIRSENPGIQKLQVVIQELRVRLPGDLRKRDPIVLGETPRMYIIARGCLTDNSI